jgi:hypothetical protein
MMTSEMIAPSHASRDISKIRNIAAATRVEADITESSVASSPELTSEAELTFLPTDLTYRHSTILTTTAAPTIIRETVE